jgi:hypothetical protein
LILLVSDLYQFCAQTRLSVGSENLILKQYGCITRLDEGKVRIVTRVLGIVLAALAVQYVLDGIADDCNLLARGP